MSRILIPDELVSLRAAALEALPKIMLTERARFYAAQNLQTACALLEDTGAEEGAETESIELAIASIASALNALIDNEPATIAKE